MQPHSISALAVAKHILANRFGLKIPKSAEVEIEWKNPAGENKYIFHHISKIDITQKDKHNNIIGLDVAVRTKDGECTLHIKRKSDGEVKLHEKLYATHSIQHLAGLEEHYQVSRSSIRGFHLRSYKYGDFVCTDANDGSLILYCKVRVGNSEIFKSIPYKVKVRPKSEENVKELLKEEEKEERKPIEVVEDGRVLDEKEVQEEEEKQFNEEFKEEVPKKSNWGRWLQFWKKEKGEE